MGNLGGLAAMAGINLNSSSGADAISPDLYPDVVQSIPFLLELFPVQVESEKGDYSSTLYEYMNEDQKSAWWSYVMQAPFKLLGVVKDLFSKEEEKNSTELSSFHLTKEQSDVIEDLQERISASVDKKTSVITVSVQMQDPLISANITQIVLEKLQGYITNYRTQKVKQDLEFTEKVFGEARESYYKAQRAYAAFEDANKNIISASYRTEQDKLRVQEQTPVYTIIQPATVPLKASSPKKPLILIGFVFLAIFGGIGYLFIKDLFKPKEETEVLEVE